MKCAVHGEVDATGFCRNCGKAMCAACVRQVHDVFYCEDCLAQVMGIPAAPATIPGTTAAAVAAAPTTITMPVSHVSKPGANPVVAFILGLIPGLGAIYNAEYNKALVHIMIFAGIILGLSSDFGQGLTPIFVLAVVVFPFYMAIDAMRVARARATGEQMNDPFEAWTKNRPIGPIILIGLGALFLLNNFGVFDFFRVRQVFWPVVLIGVGFLMLRNRVGGRS
jgi:TM2 domain-containing membrane protein YozV